MTPKPTNNVLISCDVVVLGGGPAGSTIAALLAEKGWHVEVLEKDTHPRFHIGESLLPHSLPFLERLGVLGSVEKIGLKKYGAEVISSSYHKRLTFHFANAMNPSHPYAFQVRRSEFDQILLHNCRRKGAMVHEGLSASDVVFGQNGLARIQAVDAQRTRSIWEARYVVDATGRGAFLAGRLGLKRRNPHHNSVAFFSHFAGVERSQGKDTGNISLIWFEYGWFWMIPFKDRITSVGAVCWPSYLKTRTGDIDQFFEATVALCPPVAERLKNAKLTMPVMVAGNYSYQATQMVGEAYILIGDAYAFVDPVFSSGVHLAMNSAMLGAEVVDAYLKGAPEFKTVKLRFERTVQKGLKTFSWFIYRFTQPAFQYLLLFPRNIFRVEEAILSIFAGDVFREHSYGLRLFLFKTLYYLVALFTFRKNFHAYRFKKRGMGEHVPDNH